MLAKELKIKTILKQRQFIENMISAKSNIDDGDPAYPYIGHVYVENLRYFQSNGFDVKCVESDDLKTKYNGLPIYIFTPSDQIVLSDEEMKEAEKYKGPSVDEIDAMAKEAANDILQSIVGIERTDSLFEEDYE